MVGEGLRHPHELRLKLLAQPGSQFRQRSILGRAFHALPIDHKDLGL